MIGMVDFGVGNIGSIGNILKHLELDYVHTADRDLLSRCERLVLPGVGAFEPAMSSIRALDLEKFLIDWALADKPILGICLGMQLLFEKSFEDGEHQGLGLIEGQVVPIVNAPRRVHMGWNTVHPTGGSTLLDGVGYAYFVHSYHCRPEHEATVAGVCEFGESLTAAVQFGSICGVQFHPEKSQKYGMDILKRFNDGKI